MKSELLHIFLKLITYRVYCCKSKEDIQLHVPSFQHVCIESISNFQCTYESKSYARKLFFNISKLIKKIISQLTNRITNIFNLKNTFKIQMTIIYVQSNLMSSMRKRFYWQIYPSLFFIQFYLMKKETNLPNRTGR